MKHRFRNVGMASGALTSWVGFIKQAAPGRVANVDVQHLTSNETQDLKFIVRFALHNGLLHRLVMETEHLHDDSGIYGLVIDIPPVDEVAATLCLLCDDLNPVSETRNTKSPRCFEGIAYNLRRNGLMK